MPTIIISLNSKYIPINLQGLCHIWIRCRLQETATKYQGEGFSHIYVACTGTNTQCLINFLETMFGDLDEPDLEDLETAAAQAISSEAAATERANVEASEGPIPADKVMWVIMKSLPVTMELGLETNMQPETDPIKKMSKRDPKEKITHFYYSCCKCSYSSQKNLACSSMHDAASILNWCAPFAARSRAENVVASISVEWTKSLFRSSCVPSFV